MPGILIVDDDPLVHKIAGRILSGKGYVCSSARDAAEAKRLMESQPFDLVFCDINLPGGSGIDLTRDIKSLYRETAVIVLTSRDDAVTADAAIEAGVDGYILKPFNTHELIINTRTALRKRQLEYLNRQYRLNLEQMLEERTAKLEKAVTGIFLALAKVVESKDPYTAGHQLRVSRLASAIFKSMGASYDQVEGIRLAAMIHDLGKVAVPLDILSKPTKLSKIELDLVRTHPKNGSDILSDIPFPWPIAQIILQHHERMDGSGYPRGLSDGQILPEAKVLAVADVIEAMASYRPYRPALSLDQAYEEIDAHKGSRYDSAVVDALHRVDRNMVAEVLH